MEVSSLLKQPDAGALPWLDAMQEHHALIAGALRVMHPEQYEAGLAAMRQVSHVEGVAEALHHWHLPFNAMTTIFNRCSPPHRDSLGHPRMFDLLLNLGNHQDESRMRLAGLGLSFAYHTGSLVGFSGKFCQHEGVVGQGDRICLAYYMRHKVLARAGIHVPEWMYHSTYL